MSITSANAVLLLSIPGVYTAGQRIQGFGVDEAWIMDRVAATETKVGVDGFGTAGYIPRSPKMTIRLLADSPSYIVFENWIYFMDQVQDVVFCAMNLLIPAVSRKYIGYKGSLMNVSTVADAKKVLDDRDFEIQWLPQGTIPAVTAGPS